MGWLVQSTAGNPWPGEAGLQRGTSVLLRQKGTEVGQLEVDPGLHLG